MEDIEEWKSVVNYEGLYEISTFGRIKSLPMKKDGKISGFFFYTKEIIKKNSISSNGYYVVGLNKDKKRETKCIHLIMAEAFLNHKYTPVNNLVVNHIDGNKLNNNLQNLEIVTKRENSSTCFRKNANKTSSKYVGVSIAKGAKKYRSCIVIGKKRIHIGMFDFEIDAANAYKKELDKIKQVLSEK